MAVYKEIESAVIHAGIYGDKYTRAVNVPIYQTSTFEQTGIQENPQWEYARSGNPTRAALEALISDLEKGYKGFAFASGMAAIAAVLTLFKSGDTILVSNNVYGGTFRILDKVFKNFDLNYVLVDTSSVDNIKENITDKVKAVYIETPTNPLMNITDIKAVSELAKSYGLLTIVDNTFMTPYLQRPIELGADIVVHSATKYLGGHSDLVAGLAVVNTKELADRMYFIQNSVGAVLGPFDSFLLIRGIKTAN
ncbi:MAG: aminotransferase class V-fold PLP-dependent enzyme [Succinivibrio sp.]|uniref:trans-sulfuration enzyme family protein n=1 Tax=Succinivibrio sp. TaxID=2053619 RepID=UPI002F95854E